jgi:hypothetical protein
MKKTAQTFAVVVIVFLAIAIGLAGVPQGHTKLKGQIIAYRPADRILQVVSHVLNRESFLFRVSNSESNSQAVVMKLVYEHFGYSDLEDDVLSKTPMLQLNVRRDTTCDETYGAFVQNSPTLREERAKNDPSEKVIFIEPFQKMKLSPEQPLKCYKLRAAILANGQETVVNAVPPTGYYSRGR